LAPAQRRLRLDALGDVARDGDDDVLAEVRRALDGDLLQELAPVLAAAPPLEPLRRPAHGLAEDLPERPGVDGAGHAEEVRRLPDELGAGVAVGPHDGLVDVEETALEVLDVDELGEVVEEAAVARLAGAEGFGGLPLLGDVADDGDHLAAV